MLGLFKKSKSPLLINGAVLEKCDKNALSVEIPDGVQKIGSSAFQDCSLLKEIVIPNSVQKISFWAFDNCVSLKSVVIGSGVEEISDTAFFRCTSLEKIESKSPNFIVEGGCLIVKKSKALLTTQKGSVCVSSSVRKISDRYSLSNCSKITFEQGGKITAIPVYLEMKSNRDVYNAVKAEVSKNKAKKQKLSAVASVSVGAILSVLLEQAGLKQGEDEKVCVIECKDDKSHHLCVDAEPCGLEIRLLDSRVASWKKTLPEFLEAVSSGESFAGLLKTAKEKKLEIAEMNAKRFLVLEDCSCYCVLDKYSFKKSNLKTVFLGEGLEFIDNESFCECTALRSVALPSSLQQIGSLSFAICLSLSHVEFAGTMSQWDAVLGKKYLLNDNAVESVKCADGDWKKPVVLVEKGVAVKCLNTLSAEARIPDGAEVIDAFSFEYCTGLLSVFIPKSVKKIHRVAFSDCKKLVQIEFGGTQAEWNSIDIAGNTPKQLVLNQRTHVKCTDSYFVL